ncbi:MAG: cupin [Ilumatobacter sp.]
MSDVMQFDAGDFVHLGLGATVESLPRHTGEMEWYAGYGQAHASDGVEGRLVAMWTFDESWDSWEMHPKGAELVLCVAGSISLTQESPDGDVNTTRIEAGQAVVNEPGVWHTADVEPGASATVVFITAGEGTEHRPR